MKLDISYPASEFTKLVKTWDRYDPSTMGIAIRNVKRFAHLFAESAGRS